MEGRMKEYLTDKQDVLNALESSYETGLSQAEAQRRLEKNGKNKLLEAQKETVFQRFIAELKDPMLIVLMCAALVSAITSLIKSEVPTDAIVIVIVVLLNAVLGVYQESKAEKAIEALQEMAAATSKVIRDGYAQEIKTEDVVVGDIVLLEAGMAVPCDMRIIEQASLQCEEAALTGESLPVYKTSETLNLSNNVKDVPLGDRKNMAYAGSTVVYGRGKAVATATGMDTEMGKIADALTKTADGQTPLQIKLNKLSMVLTKLVLGICVLIFVFSLLRSRSWDLENMLDVFLIAVSLAVAAIPEGLATVVTIVLSIGVTNMSKRNAIIRKLTAVETLGSTQIICSDKTGTLTQNKMTVLKRFGKDKTLLTRAMALCSDSQWVDGQAVGEPTENALVTDAAHMGMTKENLGKQYPRIAEAPFDSVRKMMSVFVKEDGKIRQYTKGAPDILINMCDTYWDGENIQPITEEVRSTILKQNHEMAEEALRVLSCAMRIYDELPGDINPDKIEKNMCFVGMVGMLDPVRPEVISG
jgi:Ca2+-transporting ATPase